MLSLQKFLSLIATYPERDKFVKLIQYGAKISPSTGVLSVAAADARKMFRITNVLNETKYLRNAIATDSYTVDDFGSRFSFLLFWAYDALGVANKNGIVAMNQKWLSKRAGLFWLIACAFAGIGQLRRIANLLYSSNDRLDKLRRQLNRAYASVVRIFCDAVIAFSLSGLFKRLFGRDMKQSKVGIFGVVSALLALGLSHEQKEYSNK